MAVTLSNNEKKALSEIFSSLNEEKSFWKSFKDMIKRIKRSLKGSLSN